MVNNIKVVDCHVHVSSQTDVNYLAGFLSGTGTDAANIAACSHSRCISLVPQALMMKIAYPGRFYVYAAPDLSAYYLHADDLGEYMALYGQRLAEMGCDGIKMLEGKPQMRKKYPIPDFDLPVWEPFWAWAEESGTPILWHVNDPECFWDASKAPSFAVSQGWLYDESYINNEEQYRQVLAVLERHPGLKIIFAHFFFMSAQLERLSAVLDRFANVMVDLTPGIEMYESFSGDIGKAREFFSRYGKRICYGTDIGGRCILMGERKEFDPLENIRRPQVVREFLTGKAEREIRSDGHYLVNNPPFTMRPLSLDEKALADILGGNFMRQTGETPKPVNAKAVLAECARLREVMKKMQKKVPGFAPDRSVIEKAELYFI